MILLPDLLKNITSSKQYRPGSILSVESPAQVGKTSLVLDLALETVLHNPNVTVDYFSTELPPRVFIIELTAHLIYLKYGKTVITNRFLSNLKQSLQRIRKFYSFSAESNLEREIRVSNRQLVEYGRAHRLNFYNYFHWSQIIGRIKRDAKQRQCLVIIDQIDPIDNLEDNDFSLPKNPSAELNHILGSLKELLGQRDSSGIVTTEYSKRPGWAKMTDIILKYTHNELLLTKSGPDKSNQREICLFRPKDPDNPTQELYFNKYNDFFIPADLAKDAKQENLL